MKDVTQIAALKKKMAADLVLISNDVGGGLVPESEMGRVYRDAAGKTNQLLAQASDTVYLVTAGIPVKIK